MTDDYERNAFELAFRFKRRRDAEKHRYNAWGGNPGGDKYDPNLCAESVTDRDRMALSHQCFRRPGHGPDGLFCLQHSPEYLRERRLRWQAKYDAEREAEHRTYALAGAKREALDILVEIARWMARNRELVEADEWLAQIAERMSGNEALMERVAKEETE